MSSKPRFEFIGLQLFIAGCPNSCRHCKDEGRRPCGELMSFDDVKWVVEQFRDLTKSEPPIVKYIEAYPFHEPTAHPDFLSLWEYCAETCEGPFDVLSTNGYGIARADNYRQMLKRLRELGTEMISSTLHGLEEHHDWFVCRKGAFQDIFVAAERAARAGLKVHFNTYLDRRGVKDFVGLIDFIHRFENSIGKDSIEEEINLGALVPAFVVGNQRLRVYESKLRPRLADFEMLHSSLEAFRILPYDMYIESSWIEKILSEPTHPSLKEGFCDVSDGEGSFVLAVDRLFNVYQRPFNCDWLAVKHGNLKTDGLAVILDRMEVWRPPQLPDMVTLAERYGDRNSTLIHKYAFSVRNKWLDIYWRDKGNVHAK